MELTPTLILNLALLIVPPVALAEGLKVLTTTEVGGGAFCQFFSGFAKS